MTVVMKGAPDFSCQKQHLLEYEIFYVYAQRYKVVILCIWANFKLRMTGMKK